MANDWRDQPAQVRAGEELDTDRLADYLQAHLPDLSGPLLIQQFPKGFSNLTYLVQVGNLEFVLRRPPFGLKIKSAHDMGREYTILSHLHRVYPKVPDPLLYCEDETILGAPFYLMKRLKGIILRPGMAQAMVPDPPHMQRIAHAFIDNLAELHEIDYQAAGLGNLGRPAGYIERQIKGWTKRYQNARTGDVPELERVAAWLSDHIGPEFDAAFIDNDYKYNNLILDPNDWSTIMAVLDWEMATLGDPLMDLGTTLGYWIEPDDPELMQILQYSPTNLPGNPSRTDLVERYARKSGREVSNINFYYIYGLFKLAVIIQQIFYRYKSGFTQDSRFARLDQEVELIGRIAVQVITKQRIDRLFS